LERLVNRFRHRAEPAPFFNKVNSYAQEKSKANKSVHLQVLPVIHPHAAGIDVGAKEHVVAVPCDRDERPVRTFQAFTPELHELARWLKRCGIETVALESTGIYWISLYEVLEQYGLEIRVVNARHVKHVPGRTKTDVLDCQWIQKLHSFGLLNGSFRPDQQVRKLRTYLRLRENLVVSRAQAVHHMQKALFEMNVQLSNVISDIVGETGLHIVEAIIAGERDPKQLAALSSSRIKASRETVAKSSHGNWNEALLFALKVTLESYRFNQTKIQECDCCIEHHLAQFGSRAELPNSPQNLQAQLHRVCGVDLTKIPGIKEQAAQIIISEVGLDMTKWNTEKQFSAFLGLCPDNSISGGKVLRRSTRKVYNRAADTLRLCAQSLTHSKSALEAKYRRLKARLGAPKAIVARAHHLARLVYRMLRYGQNYVEKGIHHYELKFRLQRIKWLKKEAHSLNLQQRSSSFEDDVRFSHDRKRVGPWKTPAFNSRHGSRERQTSSALEKGGPCK
jgi:transposase